MQTQEAITKRKSVRDFLEKEIPQEDLIQLIEAARRAPTARGEQPWEFIVITDKDKKRQLAAITGANGAFIADSAATVAVFCLDTKYYLEDGSAATENIILSACDLGIGSCWVAGDKKPYCQAINQALGVPEKYKLVSMITLGYPKTNAKIKERRPLEEVLHWQKF